MPAPCQASRRRNRRAARAPCRIPAVPAYVRPFWGPYLAVELARRGLSAPSIRGHRSPAKFGTHDSITASFYHRVERLRRRFETAPDTFHELERRTIVTVS